MTRVVALAGLLSVVACATASVPPVPTSTPEPPDLRGTLVILATDADGDPVPGARVDIGVTPATDDGVTDGNGYWSRQLAQGVIDWEVHADGYAQDAGTATLRGTADVVVRVHATLSRTAPSRRHGPVRSCGRAFCDDDGAFNALGASLFWMAWGEAHDPARLDANLAWLAQEAHVDYVRALSMVGAQPYWRDRVIDPNAPDHFDVWRRATRRAWDRYGIRVQWTLFADAQVMRPRDREAYVRQAMALVNELGPAVFSVEIANEYWQNGFEPDELRRLTALARSLTDRPVASSAPGPGFECRPDIEDAYRGDVADFGTPHFDRTYWENGWRPVRQPWEWQFCDAAPAAFAQNEPIGPQSSVASETDPAKIQAAYVTGLLSGSGAYVFHTDAGIRGDRDLWNDPGAALAARWLAVARAALPPGLANWERFNHHWAGHPFAGSLNDQIVPDGAREGVVRAFAAGTGRFVVAPIGIVGRARLTARAPMHVIVHDPATWAPLLERDLAAGETLTIEGREYVVITGEYR